MRAPRASPLRAELLISALLRVWSKEQELKFTPVSDEERYAEVMPEEYRCDACTAVIYQIGSALNKTRIREKSGLDKDEARDQAVVITSTLEAACQPEVYKEYGPKEVDGTRWLHGPGIEIKKDGMGFQATGYGFKQKLASRCRSLVEEKDEDSLLAAWRTGQLDIFCKIDCGLAKKERSTERTRESAVEELISIVEQSHKKAAKRQFELPPPPHLTKVIKSQRKMYTAVSKKDKFVIVLFHDSTPRSSRAIAIVELAARTLSTAKEVVFRRTRFARYDQEAGKDTWGFKHELPFIVLYQKHGVIPEHYDGDFSGPSEIVGWAREKIIELTRRNTPEDL